MTLLTTAGWLICGILGLLLVFQLRNTRELTFPRRGKREDWPSLSIVLTANEPARLPEVLGAVARQDYDGELEILVLADRSDAEAIRIVERLAIAHPRIRIVEANDPDPQPDRRSLLDRAARGEFGLFIGSDIILDRGAAAATVGQALDWDLDAVALTSRVDPRSFAEMLLFPLIPFVHYTFFPGRLFERATDQFVLMRRSISNEDEAADEIRPVVMNGRFLITRATTDRTSHPVAEEISNEVSTAIGSSFLRIASFAILLLALFVVPALVTLATGDRAWLMATVIGLFLRLRSAIRTGEPVALTLIHPVAVLAFAMTILTVEAKSDSRSDRDERS